DPPDVVLPGPPEPSAGKKRRSHHRRATPQPDVRTSTLPAVVSEDSVSFLDSVTLHSGAVFCVAGTAQQPLSAQLAAQQPLSAQLAAQQPLSAQLAAQQPLSAQLAAQQPLSAQLAAQQPLSQPLSAQLAAQQPLSAQLAAQQPLSAQSPVPLPAQSPVPAAPSKVGWMPSLLTRPGFLQKVYQLSMKPTSFLGHHSDSQQFQENMRLNMSLLV
uniref:Uncharacterized protein n=1 Tax=Oreochromis aureus TaxID=47969 RepID=A0AAZ1XJP6_OREAU